MSMTDKVSRLEKRLITWALKQTGNNKSRASVLLGVKRTTLVEKMRRLEMPLSAPCRPAAQVTELQGE